MGSAPSCLTAPTIEALKGLPEAVQAEMGKGIMGADTIAAVKALPEDVQAELAKVLVLLCSVSAMFPSSQRRPPLPAVYKTSTRR